MDKIRKLYFPELDGLRAFAVLIVIINHFNKELLPSGFLGVDIFFLISGFVITSSLINREESNFWEFITNFYTRRIKRIYPALIACVILTGLFLCLFNDNPEYEMKTALTSIFGLSNIYLIKISMNYFSQSAEINPFLHTWSLGVEEQFYFLFPLLVWNSKLKTSKKFSESKLFFSIGIFAIFSLILFVFLYQNYKTITYFIVITRFWEIASGSLLFLYLQKKSKLTEKLTKIPSIPIFLSIIIVLFFPLKNFIISTLLIISLTCILIISLRKQTIVYSFLTNKKIVYLGLLSYSLYLWHWPIIAISRITIGIHWWSIPFQIILILIFAFLSYFYIEKPIRKNNPKLLNKRNIFFISGITLVIATSGIFLINKFNYFFYIGNKELNKYTTVFKYRINGKELNDQVCQNILVFNGQRPECIVKPKKANYPTIHLFGDSHMQHYLPLFEKIARENGYGYQFYGRSGFPIGERKSMGSLVDDKRMYFIIDETIKKLSKNDIFLISERHERNFAPNMLDGTDNLIQFYEKDKEITKEDALKRYESYLKSIFKKINEKEAHLIIFQPTHSFKGITIPANICRQWFSTLNQMCKEGLLVNRELSLKNLLNIREMHLRIATDTNNGIKIFDPFPILCPEEKLDCSQVLEKKVLYMDNDHLSEEGALIMYEDFLELLENL